MPVCSPPNSRLSSARPRGRGRQFGAHVAERAQYDYAALDPFAGPAVIAAITFDVHPSLTSQRPTHCIPNLWLTGAVQVIFMSYYIPLPGLNDAGLEKVWNGLDVVSRIVTRDGAFHMAAPMEFRFVKGGDTAMSATFAENPQNTWFGNLDLIGFVKKEQTPSDYSPKLLQFFAYVEREWVKMGGFPHNGKMYGFYDPNSGRRDPYGPIQPELPGRPSPASRRAPRRLRRLPQEPRSQGPFLQQIFLQSLLESGRARRATTACRGGIVTTLRARGVLSGDYGEYCDATVFSSLAQLVMLTNTQAQAKGSAPLQLGKDG